ncbi:MAG TPA: lysylphosphatidylglycerol synthase transmembrane domain-containing protein [Lapillicoccus sp.]|uniref:lysylphosphatidylglycerol synthase transmembrane domain-containing protein n=1 Tax=Lapillicoccus sp. TaxID=1909287 RepID=UPI002F921A8F
MRRSRTVAIVRVVVAVAVVVALVWGVARNWTEISQDLQRVSIGALLLSFVPAALGTWLTMVGWRVILADLGSPLHLAPAGGVFFVGQLGKYLPGSVWTVLVQADMASHLHVPRRRTGVTGLVTIGLSVLTGLLVGLPALPLLLQRSAGSSGWLLLAVPLLVVLVWPALLNRLIAWGLRVLRREPLEETLSTRAILTTVGLYALAWVLFGVHILVLALAVGGGTGVTLASLTGYALAGSLGMLTVILPAGLGARDGILAIVLASAMPLSAGTAVALVSRFVVTLVDVLAAAAGWAYARRHHLVTSREEREHSSGETVPEKP